MSSVLRREKSQQGTSPMNALVETWLRFCFLPQKLTPKHRCLSWCVITVQNPWLVFLQFYAFLMNCFAQLAHNFKVVFHIDHTTWLARIRDAPCHCNRRKQWAKPLHLSEIDVLFSVLSLLHSSIGMIGLWLQCYSRTPLFVTSYNHFEQIWMFVERCQHLLSEVHATLFLLKIQQYWNNLRCRTSHN